jgi:hypothetical protein
MKKILLIFTIVCSSYGVDAQLWSEFYQYFDGADTIGNPYHGVLIIEKDSNSLWQIGVPNKTYFTNANTSPNVIVTDTLNPYPINDTSSFQLGLSTDLFNFSGIIAFQWTQKLDIKLGEDIGLVEYSVDTGNTWVNIFNNPYVYNFYGYNNNQNVDTINNEVGFSGFDNNWKDIWLCFDGSYFSTITDTLIVRYTFKSDSIFDNRDGWMIDNFVVHPTWFHTINELEQDEYALLFPNPTKDGKINIQIQKSKDYQIIESIKVYDVKGVLVKSYGLSPTKFQIDLSGFENGTYVIKIETNKKVVSKKIVLELD